MADMSIQYDNEGNNRRMGERRCGDRRKTSNNNGNFSNKERRSAYSERRTTIINRLNKEVTDRRSLN